MLIIKHNQGSWIEILMFRFENNNLGLEYQFLGQISCLNLNIKFQNWNVSFQIQITVFIFPFLDSINTFQS